MDTRSLQSVMQSSLEPVYITECWVSDLVKFYIYFSCFLFFTYSKWKPYSAGNQVTAIKELFFPAWIHLYCKVVLKRLTKSEQKVKHLSAL